MQCLNMRISRVLEAVRAHSITHHIKRKYITIDYFAYGNVDKLVFAFPISIICNKSMVIYGM